MSWIKHLEVILPTYIEIEQDRVNVAWPDMQQKAFPESLTACKANQFVVSIGGNWCNELSKD